MDPRIRSWLSEMGRRGGRKSRRVLDPDAARKMVKVREVRRAYRRFHAQCFWSFDPDYTLGLEDIPWAAGQLRKHGGREAWQIASRLCR